MIKLDEGSGFSPILSVYDYKLDISCKRFKMNIERANNDFVTDLAAVRAQHDNSAYYLFPHPSLDNYFSHLKYVTVVVNNLKFTKYHVMVGSAKGQYTYDYFRLKEFEEDTMNVSQGLKSSEELSYKIPLEIAICLEENLKKL